MTLPLQEVMILLISARISRGFLPSWEADVRKRTAYTPITMNVLMWTRARLSGEPVCWLRRPVTS